MSSENNAREQLMNRLKRDMIAAEERGRFNLPVRLRFERKPAVGQVPERFEARFVDEDGNDITLQEIGYFFLVKGLSWPAPFGYSVAACSYHKKWGGESREKCIKNATPSIIGAQARVALQTITDDELLAGSEQFARDILHAYAEFVWQERATFLECNETSTVVRAFLSSLQNQKLTDEEAIDQIINEFEKKKKKEDPMKTCFMVDYGSRLVSGGVPLTQKLKTPRSTPDENFPKELIDEGHVTVAQMKNNAYKPFPFLDANGNPITQEQWSACQDNLDTSHELVRVLFANAGYLRLSDLQILKFGIAGVQTVRPIDEMIHTPNPIEPKGHNLTEEAITFLTNNADAARAIDQGAPLSPGEAEKFEAYMSARRRAALPAVEEPQKSKEAPEPLAPDGKKDENIDEQPIEGNDGNKRPHKKTKPSKRHQNDEDVGENPKRAKVKE